MIQDEISLVIQKIFSVKQPKDQRFPEDIINGCFIILFSLFSFIFYFHYESLKFCLYQVKWMKGNEDQETAGIIPKISDRE